MGDDPIPGDAADETASSPRPAPTVLRILVGAQLRRLREACGITCEEAGAAIRASHSKISRLESGRTAFKQRDVADLLTLYGVDDTTEREAVLEMAEQAGAPQWWHAYADVIPHWFEAYVSLEPGAELIRTYEVQFVPGLLQTDGYARAVIRLGYPHATYTEIEHRLDLRRERQRILHRPNPPRLWSVIDEAALRRPLGGTTVMCEQLEHLIEMAELPHVTISIMPFSAGGHAAAGGPVTILRFAEDEIPDLVYLEQLASAVYPAKAADVDGYRHIMNRLAVEAQPPGATPSILRQILRETEARHPATGSASPTSATRATP